MSATSQTHRAEIAHPPGPTAVNYALLTLVPAVVAALAAFATLSLGWAPWIMFMGWVAYFTRPSPPEGLQTYGCVVIGLVLGAFATLAVGALTPILGQVALPSVVFTIALVVIATRGLPLFNNLLGYFIGLITFFAAHQTPQASTVATLAAAVAMGALAGLLSQWLSGRVKR
jgi:hypothetical protein